LGELAFPWPIFVGRIDPKEKKGKTTGIMEWGDSNTKRSLTAKAREFKTKLRSTRQKGKALTAC